MVILELLLYKNIWKNHYSIKEENLIYAIICF